MDIHQVTVNYRTTPTGIPTDNATIRWALTGSGSQTAFQVILIPAFGKVYDSGKLSSPQQSHQVPAGVLDECQAYDLKLHIWSDTGDMIQVSYQRYLITARSTEFEAKWIWTGIHHWNQHIYFRRILPAPKDNLVAAIVYITADDYYKLNLDGQYVGQGPALFPASQHNYNTWDITQMLQAGKESMFGIHAYYMGKESWAWLSGDSLAGVIAEVHYIYNDHREIVAKTDASWDFHPCRHYLSGHMFGYDTGFSENIDARNFITDWNTLNGSSEGWNKALEVTDPQWGLVPQDTSPLEVYDVAPETIKKLNDGHFFIDFGKEYAGCFAMTAQGEAGTEVQIRLGEELNPDGSVRFDIRANCVYQERCYLSGNEDYFEQYDYKAFRYAELINYPGELTKDKVKIIARNNPFNDEQAVFGSSEPLLEQIWDICKQGLKVCSQDLYVDCPTREKSQYAGDMYIEGVASHIASGEALMQKRALDYFLNFCNKAGLVSTRLPDHFNSFNPDYVFMLFLIADRYYLETGDLAAIQEWTPLLERIILRWEASITDQGLLGEIVVPKGKSINSFTVVDWPPVVRNTFEMCPVSIPINALYHEALSILSSLMNITGNQASADKYAKQAENLKEAINTHLLDQDGFYFDGIGSTSKSFHSALYCLRFGITPEEHVQTQLDFIIQQGMNCGVYGACFLLELLYNFRKSDHALNLMRATNGNSWGSMLAEGATCCTEVWRSEQKENISLCHAWSASPLFILPTQTMGIRPLKPGYEQILIDPQPGDLQNTHCGFDTIKGRIEAQYTRNNNMIEFNLTIPFGSTAEFTWKNSPIAKASLNGESFTVTDDTVLIQRIPSGKHIIELECAQ